MVDRIVVLLSVVICMLSVTGCDRAGDGSKTAGTSAAGSLDRGMEQARSDLLVRDLAFGNAVAERGLAEAYRQFLAADAVQLPDGDWPLRGRDVIYEQILEATLDTDFALSWKPEAAEVSVSGDLGYTWGTYWLELLDEGGNPMVLEGNYVNVWRKSEEGVWQVIVDISNQIETDYAATAVVEFSDQIAAPDTE